MENILRNVVDNPNKALGEPLALLALS
jgi:hypothetical protein